MNDQDNAARLMATEKLNKAQAELDALVARLRERKAYWLAGQGINFDVDCKDAADTITALRAERDHWREANRATLAAGDVLKQQLDKALADLAASRELLIEARDEWINPYLDPDCGTSKSFVNRINDFLFKNNEE